MKLSVIVPSYNSATTIRELIQRIKKVEMKGVVLEIIVVDDGSTDKTYEYIKDIKNIHVFRHKRNRGKGAAVRTGLEHATGEILFLQDSDLEYDPKDIPSLVQPILVKKTEVVFSSRRLNKKNRYSSKLYKWGGAFVDGVISMALGANISDASSGSKAFTKQVYNKIKPLHANKFDIEAEITAKIIKKGYTPIEVPISYYPRTFKEGKNIRWYHALRILQTLIKNSF